MKWNNDNANVHSWKTQNPHEKQTFQWVNLQPKVYSNKNDN